ncbi:hypothetical protein [Tateyamaria sp. SN3-11]|uniref:hypothetical protein n=1 Tax=Tateyamaria sp. SN3-11 TaxID=3092147 RepID=UPI0039E8B60A
MILKIASIVVGVLGILAASKLGAAWWAFVPFIALVLIGLLLLGAFDMDADRSGLGGHDR